MSVCFRGPLPGGAGIIHIQTPIGRVTMESSSLTPREARAGHCIASYLTRVEGRTYVALLTDDVLVSMAFVPGDDGPTTTQGVVIPFRPRGLE